MRVKFYLRSSKKQKMEVKKMKKLIVMLMFSLSVCATSAMANVLTSTLYFGDSTTNATIVSSVLNVAGVPSSFQLAEDGIPAGLFSFTPGATFSLNSDVPASNTFTSYTPSSGLLKVSGTISIDSVLYTGSLLTGSITSLSLTHAPFWTVSGTGNITGGALQSFFDGSAFTIGLSGTYHPSGRSWTIASGNIIGTSQTPVPEPSTIALGVMGVCAFLARRRMK